MRDEFIPWPIDELVRAQCMECDGIPLEEIARLLGRDFFDVAHHLRQPEDGKTKSRPERANLGYAHLKRVR